VFPSRWRRHGLSTVVAAAVLVGWVGLRSTDRVAPAEDAVRYHDQSCRVARVIDGDTLDIDLPDGDRPVTRVRLWGVDTAETDHGGERDMYFGREASAFAEQTLEGRSAYLVLSPARTRDKYGRLLAYVYLTRGGPMFNEILLEQGFAYADRRFDHLYEDRFESLEKRARQLGVGLWAAVTPDKMPPWRRRMETRNREASNP
jgi:endonuclease YncB( thermonuclease family)